MNLHDRFANLARADGWPSMKEGAPPTPEQVAQYDRHGFWEVAEAWRQAESAVKGRPQVSVAQAHAFLDALDDFNRTSAHLLTFPASWAGWAKAVRQAMGAAEHSDAARTHLAAVFAYQPAAVLRVLAPALRTPPPTPESPPRAVQDDKPRSPRPSSVPSNLDPDAEQLVQDLVAGLDQGAGWEARWDARLQKARARDDWEGWWSDQVFPALCRQPADVLARLASHWPEPHRVVVADPARWLTRPSFWKSMREATPEQRQVLHEQILPRVVAAHYWSPQESQDVLHGLLRFTQKNPALCRQRLALWQAWGGDLDAPQVRSSSVAEDASSWEALSPPSMRDVLLAEADAPAWQDVFARSPRRGGPSP